LLVHKITLYYNFVIIEIPEVYNCWTNHVPTNTTLLEQDMFYRNWLRWSHNEVRCCPLWRAPFQKLDGCFCSVWIYLELVFIPFECRCRWLLRCFVVRFKWSFSGYCSWYCSWYCCCTNIQRMLIVWWFC
jgi:hypothetical protein